MNKPVSNVSGSVSFLAAPYSQPLYFKKEDKSSMQNIDYRNLALYAKNF